MISNSFLRHSHLTDKFHIQINFDSGLLLRSKHFEFRSFSGKNSISISIGIYSRRSGNSEHHSHYSAMVPIECEKEKCLTQDIHFRYFIFLLRGNEKSKWKNAGGHENGNERDIPGGVR